MRKELNDDRVTVEVLLNVRNFQFCLLEDEHLKVKIEADGSFESGGEAGQLMWNKDHYEAKLAGRDIRVNLICDVAATREEVSSLRFGPTKDQWAAIVLETSLNQIILAEHYASHRVGEESFFEAEAMCSAKRRQAEVDARSSEVSAAFHLSDEE